MLQSPMLADFLGIDSASLTILTAGASTLFGAICTGVYRVFLWIDAKWKEKREEDLALQKEKQESDKEILRTLMENDAKRITILTALEKNIEGGAETMRGLSKTVDTVHDKITEVRSTVELLKDRLSEKAERDKSTAQYPKLKGETCKP